MVRRVSNLGSWCGCRTRDLIRAHIAHYGLAAIISRRAAFLTPVCEASDLIAPDALQALIRLHRDEHARSVRRTLSVLAPALSLAVGDDSAEHVCARHINAVD
jgi:hypothetical protein